MRRFLKWAGIVLFTLIFLMVIVGSVLIYSADTRMNRNLKVEVAEVTLPTDTASLAFGRRFVQGLCAECHGEHLNGRLFFSDSQIGEIYTPNLTPGEGGIGKYYTVNDWARTLRHGVNPQGQVLFGMPSNDYAHLGARDLGAVIAYLKTLPPVDAEHAPYKRLTRVGKILVAVGAFGDAVIPAEVIDHSLPLEKAPSHRATPDYGLYLVTVSGCRTCHGESLNGAKDPNPNAPPVPNITPGGHLGRWRVNEFITAMRTGVTPEQKILDKEFMPWTAFAKMTDEELTALFLYLKSLPPLETAVAVKPS